MKTYKSWKKSIEDQRKGPLTPPVNKLTKEEKEQIVKVCALKEYADLSPSQIVPKLADKGEYIASESSFYRVLKEENLLIHRGKSRPKTNSRPLSLIALRPNQIYSWDITYLMTQVKGLYFYLYLFMDIYSRKIVGFEVYEKESMDYSAELFEKICKEENVDKNQLTLHSDNGGPMKGATMLATLQKLGVVPSFSRPSVSNDNAYSESLFKTMKYCPMYPSKPFSNIEEAKAWVKNFVQWYNYEHLHSGIKFVTPNDRHNCLDEDILKNRKEVYQKAKKQNPLRWSKDIKNFDPIDAVHLNKLSNKNLNVTNCA